MVLENLETAPLWEWLLGSGWYDGLLYRPLGLLLFFLLLLGGAAWAIRSLRRGTGIYSPQASQVLAILAAVVSVPLLASLLLCSNLVTQAWFFDHILDPLIAFLTPLLGLNWQTGALYFWLAVLGMLSAFIYVMSLVLSTVMYGPGEAIERCGRSLAAAATDVARTSPRRVLALAWLAFRESIRRRVAVVFAVFVVLILFGGWFIDRHADHPARLYIQVVLNFTMYLTLLFALILSALSIPADIRDRTLYTIVTKPVRKSEIVLGRMIGFVAMGTMLLAITGLMSYVFTVRSLNHTHEITAKMLHGENLPGRPEQLLRGITSRAHEHQHEVTVDATGGATVSTEQDHTHELSISGSGDSAVYSLGPPQGQLLARVVRYGKLSFISQNGTPAEKGVNVGDEWAYRSFIAGQTAARAIWTFDHISEARFPESEFPEGIPIEMTLEVFRTHKGNMEKGVLGTLWLRKAHSDQWVRAHNFLAQKFATDAQIIKRKIPLENGKEIDLFRDIVGDTGKLEISLQCMERGQYFGMAQADLYIREADSSFAFNFVKGYLGIWLQMVLVMAVGVFFSTFVSGPVAVIATLACVIGSLFIGSITELAGGHVIGGGPFESGIRIYSGANMISPLQPGIEARTAEVLDLATSRLMAVVASLLPPSGQSDFVDRVACGFCIDSELLTKCLLRVFAFVVPALALAFLCLKNREVAQ